MGGNDGSAVATRSPGTRNASCDRQDCFQGNPSNATHRFVSSLQRHSPRCAAVYTHTLMNRGGRYPERPGLKPEDRYITSIQVQLNTVRLTDTTIVTRASRCDKGAGNGESGRMRAGPSAIAPVRSLGPGRSGAAQIFSIFQQGIRPAGLPSVPSVQWSKNTPTEMDSKRVLPATIFQFTSYSNSFSKATALYITSFPASSWSPITGFPALACRPCQ